MTDDRQYMAMLFARQAAARDALPGERVGACCRVAVPQRKVQVWRNIAEGRAKYHNVVRCANAWQCPVCANAITANKRGVIQRVNDCFDGAIVMMTMTMRHSRTDSAWQVVSTLSDAWRHMINSKLYRKERNVIMGYCKATEITWGESTGWHPHYHVIFYIASWSDVARVYKLISMIWTEALAANGGDCNEHGCSISTAPTSIAEYVAKWGHDPEPDNTDVSDWTLAQEAARGAMAKDAKIGRYAPFVLLDMYRLSGSAKWLKLYREYAHAMRGKHQLSWSRGFYDRVKLAGDRGEDEIEIDSLAGYYLLASLSSQQWQAVVHCDMRSDILAFAARGDEGNMWSVVKEAEIEYQRYVDNWQSKRLSR